MGAGVVAAAAGAARRAGDSKSRDGKLGRAGTARIVVSSDSTGQFFPLEDDLPLRDAPSPDDRELRAGGSGST